MNALYEHFLKSVITPYLEPRLRTGSLKAAKAYVQSIRVMRGVSITSFWLGCSSAVLVTGLMLIIMGIVGLLPITFEAMAIVAIVLGVLLAAVPAIGVYMIFREKVWLKGFKAYEVMEAAMAPWEGSAMPPNPLAVMKGEGPKGVIFERDEDELEEENDRAEKAKRGISVQNYADELRKMPVADVAAANIGASAAIMAPEAPVVMRPRPQELRPQTI